MLSERELSLVLGLVQDAGVMGQWVSTEPTECVEPPERPPLARLDRQGKVKAVAVGRWVLLAITGGAPAPQGPLVFLGFGGCNWP